MPSMESAIADSMSINIIAQEVHQSVRKLNFLFLLTALSILFASCERRRKYDVTILYPNWAEGIAITHLAKVILKDKGYSVSLRRLEPGPIFISLWRGDADIFMDVWLPHMSSAYWNKYNDRLEDLGIIFNDASTGLVVPSYVKINSIEELNAHQEEFGGKIYGIASGASIFTETAEAIKVYKLNYTQVASSETSMMAVLRKAENNTQPVVITGWKPHFMWSSYDLKMLNDPQRVYTADSVHVVSRAGFRQDSPELASFFSKFKLNESRLNELMDEVAKDKDPDVGATRFYNKYKDQLSIWLVEKRKTN